MSTVSAAGFLDNARTLRWLLGHAQEARALVGLFSEFEAATTLDARWGVTKRAGDVVVGIIDTFPAADSTAVVALEDVKAQAVALGIDWDKLSGAAGKLLPLIFDFVLKLRG